MPGWDFDRSARREEVKAGGNDRSGRGQKMENAAARERDGTVKGHQGKPATVLPWKRDPGVEFA